MLQFAQEDIIPTPHHSDSKHASRTSKQYFIIVLQYLAMAIDGYFQVGVHSSLRDMPVLRWTHHATSAFLGFYHCAPQDMTREVGQNTDGSHFCKGVKSVTKMLQKLQEQELAALMNPDATNAGGMGNGPGPHAKVAPNCDVVRCSLTFDSVEMLREVSWRSRVLSDSDPDHKLLPGPHFVPSACRHIKTSLETQLPCMLPVQWVRFFCYSFTPVIVYSMAGGT